MVTNEEFPMTVGVTKFAERQLASDFGGTRLTAEQMEACRSIAELVVTGGGGKPGYAPFCQTVSIMADMMPGVVLSSLAELNEKNFWALRCTYEARREGELPVLVRFFQGLDRVPSHHLNVILYSRAQLVEEAAARGESNAPDADWSIVAVNAEVDEKDSPIPPITMMRNALGAAEGGSGVALDRAAYLASVAYWSKYAQIR
jgi:uncharacterized protein DUF3228